MGYGILGVQQEHPMEIQLETTKYKVLGFMEAVASRTLWWCDEGTFSIVHIAGSLLCVTKLRSFLCFPPLSVTVGGGRQQAADTPILIVFS